MNAKKKIKHISILRRVRNFLRDAGCHFGRIKNRKLLREDR